MGVAGAMLNSTVILIAGFTKLLARAFSTAIGEWVSANWCALT
jgi:VIT1/CCC1 family predicted Fe2+/Mn2+ transporter